VPLLLACVGFDEAPVAEVATVSFSADGGHVAVETRWVDEGPGFPNVRIELFDLAARARVGEWATRLGPDRAMEGFEGASADARAAAADALGRVGVDLARPSSAEPCVDGVCGGQASACGGRSGGVRVRVESKPSTEKVEQCYGRGEPHRLTVTVDGVRWIDETTPADGCPANYHAAGVWRRGEHVVLLLGHDVPGHEGRGARWKVMSRPPG
jgi:hypothetical protein